MKVNEEEFPTRIDIISAIRSCNRKITRATSLDIRLALRMPESEYRVVDRACQRARKAGAIKWDSKRGWTVVEGGVK